MDGDEKTTPIQIRMGANDLARLDVVARHFRQTMPERQWGRSELIRYLIEVAYQETPRRTRAKGKAGT
jgi:hypothetical protein